jgi:hypothetical protein
MHYTEGARSTRMNFIPVAQDYITDNAFGRPDMKSLYVAGVRRGSGLHGNCGTAAMMQM